MEEPEKKSINGYFSKQNIACRISDETAALIDENYELIVGDIKPVTDRKLVECLLDLALSKAKPNLESKKIIDQLQDKLNTCQSEVDRLNNEILSLKAVHAKELDERSQSFNQSSESNVVEFERLNKIIAEQKQRILILESDSDQQNKSLLIALENGILVNLSLPEKTLVTDLAEKESLASGKSVTPAMLIKSVFFFVIFHGPHDVFHSQVSLYHIKKLLAPTTETPAPQTP